MYLGKHKYSQSIYVARIYLKEYKIKNGTWATLIYPLRGLAKWNGRTIKRTSMVFCGVDEYTQNCSMRNYNNICYLDVTNYIF